MNIDFCVISTHTHTHTRICETGQVSCATHTHTVSFDCCKRERERATVRRRHTHTQQQRHLPINSDARAQCIKFLIDSLNNKTVLCVCAKASWFPLLNFFFFIVKSLICNCLKIIFSSLFFYNKVWRIQEASHRGNKEGEKPLEGKRVRAYVYKKQGW